MYTLEAFHAYSPDLSIRLVLPESQFAYWKKCCLEQGFTLPHTLVAGGETRFHSVQNGLKSIETEEGLVAVHDGVRPFVSPAIIRNGFVEAQQHGSAVTCVPLKDSARRVEADGQSVAVDRAAYRLVQTPQSFRLSWMRAAFRQPYSTAFTDCASVVEQAGYSIHLIEGAYENIKITTPDDLQWAVAFLKNPS
jgi:2-C-methyl-D-erythritol 4-phosphate cytidylyltransferase